MAAELGGDLIAPGVVRCVREVALEARHGSIRYGDIRDARLGHLDFGDDADLAKTVFLDTETTGLAGGTGTLAFLVGTAAIEDNLVVVRQYLVLRFSAEPAMLDAVARDLGPAERIVTFNGKCFDAPLLAARYRLAARTDPLAALAHVDLLHPTRRAFSRSWPDCRLQTAERELFGLHRVDDTPGSEIPEIWLDFLRTGRCVRLGGVLEHNRIDLLSLVALLPVLADVHDVPGAHGSDILALAKRFADRGDRSRHDDILRRSRDLLDARALHELARVHHKAGEYDEALALWTGLAGNGCTLAMERLAKHYEHALRDFAQAIVWTRRMIEGAPGAPEHQHRLARLQQRCARARGQLRTGAAAPMAS